MGEGVIEATITAWTKNVGDTIEEDETVVEVATDKVDSEVPSEVPGVLVEKLFDVDDVVKIGDVIAIIETDAEIEQDDEVAIIQNPELVESTTENESVTNNAENNELEIVSNEERFYSPLVKNIAKTEGVSQSELDQIKGSGKNGRVTKDDIFQYVSDKKAGKVAVDTTTASQSLKPEK